MITMSQHTKEQIKIKLGGMTCASCALKIETKLKDMNGVANSTVNFASEEATVEYDPDSTDYEDFDKAIKDLGYKASLANYEVKVLEELNSSDFDALVQSAEKIKGIHSVRGNQTAQKLFIKFNELKLGENE